MSALKKSLVAVFVSMLALSGAAVRAETSITTANSSDDTQTESGDASSSNDATAFAGHQGGGDSAADASDIDNDEATNVQEGDNSVEGNQSATSNSGSAVGGQVIGGVSDGDLTVNATNSSEDVTAETGDADSTNSFAAFVGLSDSSDTVVAADITNDGAVNVQEGDNEAVVNQSTDAVTGDGVVGQILGATTTGTADIVLANSTTDSDAASGDSDEDSSASIFTGLTATGTIAVV